ncbi:2-heptaprenyl-1,4-naphthoquinone methyltransferase [Labilithrix luteola]|uniref:2-heptaprenyl-1,4-naphthoquinone methyltransferase n=1 Tax=Labilithrix luteola TaxID=1391654 RepID=A0A0K1QDW2_9BACT|nr:class I SAM-dependent methyltransferase [Labilithrix luteola]AKV03949.1 2-heptaprenyl-1,4-naphthoquinone methyltransferase [Labilithrix luteola]
MTHPLSTVAPWDLVTSGYAEEVDLVMVPVARRALTLVDIPRAARVLDVAAGPGTLALEVASRVSEVIAVDFAPKMIATLETNAATRHIGNVVAQVADGQALPFDDASFDAAFSMFGLMFFPDRARGFSELHRVLRPKAPAVVSTWAPLERSSAMRLLFGALAAADPSPPPPPPPRAGGDPFALDSEEKLRRELTDAGFVNVSVHEHEQPIGPLEADELWERLTRGNAMLVSLRARLGEDAWSARAERAKEFLRRALPEAPSLSTTALVGVGFRR